MKKTLNYLSWHAQYSHLHCSYDWLTVVAHEACDQARNEASLAPVTSLAKLRLWSAELWSLTGGRSSCFLDMMREVMWTFLHKAVTTLAKPWTRRTYYFHDEPGRSTGGSNLPKEKQLFTQGVIFCRLFAVPNSQQATGQHDRQRTTCLGSREMGPLWLRYRETLQC